VAKVQCVNLIFVCFVCFCFELEQNVVHEVALLFEKKKKFKILHFCFWFFFTACNYIIISEPFNIIIFNFIIIGLIIIIIIIIIVIIIIVITGLMIILNIIILINC